MANTSENQHRLVILGSMDEFIELVEMAKSRGYYTIVCDGYSDGPAKAYADASYDIDVRNTDEVAAMCKAENADGIIASFSDLLAECLVKIAEKAGLKHYCEPERIRYLREKPLMKEMFAELGVPSARSVVVNKESIEEDISSLGFPCIVKPINGYGSRGVYILENVQQIEARFDEIASYSTVDHILAEELNTGVELNIMSWILDGEPVILDIADREKSNEIPFDVPHVSRIVYPSTSTATVADEAKKILKDIAGFVGIVNGPLSMQVFFDEEKGLKVCEAAGRLFGYEHELLELASSFSLEGLLLDYVYDEDAMKARLNAHNLNFDNVSAGLYFHGYEGAIEAIHGLDQFMKTPEVKEVKTYYEPGDSIIHGVGAKPYVLRLYIASPERNRIDELTEKAFSTLSVTSQTGNELLYRNEIPQAQ